jgi:hypothetical protein
MAFPNGLAGLFQSYVAPILGRLLDRRERAVPKAAEALPVSPTSAHAAE